MKEQIISDLQNIFSPYSHVTVAFSGGVDSGLLLYMIDKYCKLSVSAVIVNSDFTFRDEIEQAEKFCINNNIPYTLININVFSNNELVKNSKERCYLCKKMIFNEVIKIAENEGSDIVCDGSNVDDMTDYRPGAKALRELGIISPLQDCGITKMEIRELANKEGLPFWNKPSNSCLACRIPYNHPITKRALERVEEAERVLLDIGITGFRVRYHFPMARIECNPDDFENVIANRNKINKKFQELGFLYTTLDLAGYKTGSLNKEVKENG